MIDLKELERKLDESLANETAESLSNWLLDLRKSEMESLIGEWAYIECLLKTSSYDQTPSGSITYNHTNDNSPCAQLATAA